MTDFTLSAEIEAVRDHVNFLNEWLEYNKQRPTEATAEMQQLRNAFASVLKRLEGSRWMPIEEAPKDGTAVLGFCPKWYQGKGGFSVMCWLVSDECWFTVPAAFRDDPTHWLPLPEPPHD